ncbi:murein hydrolase activator EnvC family protein [Sphingomonas jaspsi]|uniref:murein hydrolase activator EnvC family protein n=1 Tax=Sphingomonas jaspsi TaxID=392409 RepID=UPI0004B4CCBE|nr:peptidoglycan DD-metalloendopeptidase family protein [Sphingomonas jaspsi]
MRAAALLPALACMAIAASGPVTSSIPTSDALVAAARKDARAAADRLAKLEGDAARAGDEASRLRREQAAAGAAIDEAEARISQSEAEVRAANAARALSERRLAERRAPLASLLAGLVTMGRQPPLLVLADGGGVEELVRVKALVDATRPVIERRSAALRADLDRRTALARQAADARTALAENRRLLESRRVRFADLERQAIARQQALAGQSLVAGDAVLASSETLSGAEESAALRRNALAMAAELVPMGLSPPRPAGPEGEPYRAPLPYMLPVDAPVSDGLGSVSPSGIVARGVTFATDRGAAVRAPADGTILFAAPYRGYDGVMIIDHGGGRSTMLLGLSSDLKAGSRVRAGEQIGRALGPLSVEFRDKGVPKSPAFIAASSVPLSNAGKAR